MVSLGLRVEDRLDGHTNYNVWKERMQSIFEDAEVWDIMVHTTQNPVVVPTDATQLAEDNKKNNKAIGEAIPSTELVRIAVIGLPCSWMNIADGVCARETLPTWERFWDDCIQTEIRKGQLVTAKPVEQDEGVALSAGGKKGKGKKQASTSNGGGKDKGKGKQGNTQKDYSKVKCCNCQKMGHYAVVCPEKKKKKGKNQSMAASAKDEDFAVRFDWEFGFIAYESSSAGSPATQVQREHAFPSISRASSGIWYVDSGASRHMTRVREYFSKLSESGTDIEVVLSDDRVVRVVGGRTCVDVSQGTLADLARVIGVHHAKVYKFAFQSLVALSSSTDNRASSSELCEIWHRRMGHVYHGALRTLREITTGVPDFSTDHFDTCRGCAMGKFAKSPFPSSDSRATGILDLIHSDVSGRMSHVSLSGYEYYVLFIDDHSRRTWIYFLKTKSEFFKRFQEFRALVETQTGWKIKSLRSDNGGEYTLGEFVDYCAKASIRREFTVPYNPQQNGVAERKNRSIVGVAKAMLHD
eukprot:PITA_14280